MLPTTPTADTYDPVTLEILWSRLLAIVDESATALVRTSFSTTVRESNDFACVLLSPDGMSLAENTLGVPSFAGVMSRVMRHFLAKYPAETWQPGDVGLGNDPWQNTGHLPDTTTITPIFHRGRLVAFAGNTSHKSDIGGMPGVSADGAEVFEEGLRLPVCKLYKAGELTEDLVALIRANVRVPDMVMGDLHAQVAAGHVCAERLIEFLDEQNITGLSGIGRAIQTRAEGAMRQAISVLPDGDYPFELETDGFDQPTRIATTIRIRGDDLEVDFTGTSPQVPRGINSVYNYTFAFTCYTVKCVLDPLTRKNEGSYRPIRVTAPEGCILNARFPIAVNARSMTGHFVSAAVLGALSQILPERVIADSGSCPGLRVACSGVDRYGGRFAQMLFPNGGMGARPYLDGLGCTGFPTNVGCAAVEVMEGVAPLIFWERQYLQDSGGPGRQRGGLGQRVVIEFASPEPVAIATQFDRIDHPAFGLFGGLPGGRTKLALNGTASVPGKGRAIVRPGDVLTIDYAGGGGYGRPEERDRALVAEDLKNGLVSPEAARTTYRYEEGKS